MGAFTSLVSNTSDVVIETVSLRRPDGSEVCVELFGADRNTVGRPTLLVLDGIGCTGWAFRRVIPQWTATHRVALLHYRGHGRSPLPSKPWQLAMPVLADDAAALLDAIEADTVTVVGFSMGFQVALELFRRHRSKVSALASIAGPPGRVLERFQGTRAFAHALPFARAATRYAHEFSRNLWRKVLPSPVAKGIGLFTQVNAERIPVADFEFYMRQVAAMNPELFLEMLQEANRHSALDVLPTIDVPTLVIAGAADRFIPLETMRELAHAVPHAQWVVIKDASHALPAEYPDEVAARVLSLANT